MWSYAAYKALVGLPLADVDRWNLALGSGWAIVSALRDAFAVRRPALDIRVTGGAEAAEQFLRVKHALESARAGMPEAGR